MHPELENTAGNRVKSRLLNWQSIVVILFLFGIAGAIFYPDNCPSTCKVALFASSDEVTNIIVSSQARAATSSDAPASTVQGAAGAKNIPAVAAFLSDGQGNSLIVSKDGLVTLLIQAERGGLPRCTVIHPKVDAKWCSLKGH